MLCRNVVCCDIQVLLVNKNSKMTTKDTHYLYSETWWQQHHIVAWFFFSVRKIPLSVQPEEQMSGLYQSIFICQNIPDKVQVYTEMWLGGREMKVDIVMQKRATISVFRFPNLVATNQKVFQLQILWKWATKALTESLKRCHTFQIFCLQLRISVKPARFKTFLGVMLYFVLVYHIWAPSRCGCNLTLW